MLKTTRNMEDRSKLDFVRVIVNEFKNLLKSGRDLEVSNLYWNKKNGKFYIKAISTGGKVYYYKLSDKLMNSINKQDDVWAYIPAEVNPLAIIDDCRVKRLPIGQNKTINLQP